MNREQAMDILERIAGAYSNFEIYDKRIEVWCDQLEKMPYEPVKHKLKDYTGANNFPPTIADIAVFPPPKNEFLEKVRRWEAEAERDRKTRER